MSENVIITHKRLGETPLECLENARTLYKIGANTPMTYAGRLDPMAEGVMIVLVGEECKNKEQYLGLDKVYEFEILVGFQTDTHDLLGLVIPSVNKISGPRVGSPDREILFTDSILSYFIGTFTQKYPNFSSKTVGGKQLFQLAKDDELPEDVPEHEVTIYSLAKTGERSISKKDLEDEIIQRVNLVSGDFRQKEILARWQEVFENSNTESFQIISCTLSCSSGTYVRQLVADIGRKLGIPLVTYSINRTKVGEYK